MKIARKSLFLGAALLAGSAAVAQAQMPQPGGMPGGMPGGPMPHPGMMHGGDMHGMAMGFDHIEGRLAYLKAELKITDAQLPVWNAFADVMRSNATNLKALQDGMHKGGMPATPPAHLAQMEKMMTARLSALKAAEAVVTPLYAALSPEQQKAADRMMQGGKHHG